MDKRELRKKIRLIRAGFPDKKTASEKIAHTFLSLPETEKAETIALYCSMPEEVATDRLIIKLLEEKKTVCVPLITGKEMLFIRICGLADLKNIGSFGIREPVYKREDIISADKIELAVFPGLAFDKEGNRLGYGGGYYDRAFARNDITKKIAFCFSCQLLDHIPSEAHDLKVDKIITEESVYMTGSFR